MDRLALDLIDGGLQRLIDKHAIVRGQYEAVRQDIRDNLARLVSELSRTENYTALVESVSIGGKLCQGISLKLDEHTLVLLLVGEEMQFYQDGERVDLHHIVHNYGDLAILNALAKTTERQAKQFKRMTDEHTKWWKTLPAL